MQILVGAAWLIWLGSGTAGLEKGLTVGALLVLGLGMRNILDTFWKRKSAERRVSEAETETAELPWYASRHRGYQATSDWNASRTGGSVQSPALRAFGRRFDNPRA
ncbi:MAG: hypothetical protein HY508_00380 [Acidobacteria bacterium]|nr:hypothetical protein [Acidobacteriota bacterium]